ncbi:MAG: MAPEG family protein [Terriglobia bacterium]|nr:MAPEG family protein [Terriglobia bacterium]
MTTELTWLVYTAILAASLWIPYIVGVNVTDFEGKDGLFARPPDMSKMAPWVHRSYRAHLNLLEQLLPFSLIVIAGALAKISTPITVWCAILFFWLRALHAIGMITGLAKFPIRPLLYVAGWIVTLVFASQILSKA